MRLTAGTPHPEKGMAHWTIEQLAKIDEIKDDRFELGIAKAKYVNHVLEPDGTLHADLDKIRRASADVLKEFDGRIADAKKGVEKANNAMLRATKANRKQLRGVANEALAELGAANQAQLAAAAHINQIDDHVDEGRFLFVVNELGVPVVYFQCAVPENPDLPKLRKKSAKRGR